MLWSARGLLLLGIVLLIAPDVLFEETHQDFDEHFYSGMVGMLLIFVGVTLLKIRRHRSKES